MGKLLRFSCIFINFLLVIEAQQPTTSTRYEPFAVSSANIVPLPKADPTYIITAPRVIRPDSLFRVSVALLPRSPSLSVKAIVTRQGQQVASTAALIDSGSTDSLIMKIPPTVIKGTYTLKIEGFDPQHPQTAVFSEESKLTFNPQFLTILVQTNRAIYTNSMIVRIRVVLLQMDLKPYTDPVTVYILDPEGFIMRRWPSRQPTLGVVSLTYTLPTFPSRGQWTIRVEAKSQIYDRKFWVERYYLTFFEVMPLGPAYVLDSAETYDTALTTAFHPEKIAKGNCTVTVMVKPQNSTAPFQPVKEDHFDWVEDFTYTVDLNEVRRAVTRLAGMVVRAQFAVRDFFMGEERIGFVDTRIIRANLRLKFAGSQTAVFKPGMPFTGHVYVIYDDNAAVPPEKLEKARLTLRATVTSTSGQQRTLTDIIVPPKGEYLTAKDSYVDESVRIQQWMDRVAEDSQYAHFRTTGVHQFRIDVPKDTQTLKIHASYRDEEDEISADLKAVSFHASQDSYLHLGTSTQKGAIGSYAVFHLKANFAFRRFYYVIVSKGLILYSAQEELQEGNVEQMTFSLPISTDMAPTFKVIAMVTTASGDLLADSVTVPVESISRYKMNVTLDQTRDHSMSTVQVITRTQPGSFIGMSVIRLVQHQFQAENELNPNTVVTSLYDLEPFTRAVHGVTWVDREGMKSPRTEYFPGQNPAPDVNRTFLDAGVRVLSNARISQYPETVACNEVPGLSPCLVSGCYKKEQRCDGIVDCVDGSDEDACPPPPTDALEYRIFRLNPSHDYYDWLDGDFAWYDVPITHDGEELYDVPVPVTNELWFINGFSMHGELGFSIIEAPVEFDGTMPFFMALEAPKSIRRGETLGIRINCVNNLDEETMLLLVLEASNDYMFVLTGKDGDVSHYNPTLVSGERQHMLAMEPLSMTEVSFPIAPQVEQGTITVRIRGITQTKTEEYEVEVEILPEGAIINRHTSLLMDLKNRALQLRFLDIPVEETPVIPYSKFRRYIYGSPSASVSLCGDVFGPIFPKMPLTSADMLDRPLRGTEAHLFNLASTLWSLHYLRLTNQLQADVMYTAFDNMNTEMAALMRLYDVQGSFKLHTNSKPSVWATAWVVRVLGQSQFQDWENFYFVDSRLLGKCVQWILGFQNSDGTFQETDDYSYPLDRRLAGNLTRSVGHTAHVLIALEAAEGSLHGDLKVAVSIAKTRAVNYLERSLSATKDPYEVAIVAHALTKVNSPAKETAFGKLHSMRRENNEGLVYWSRSKVADNDLTYENQKPFIMPRTPSQQNALAVETTAYALLVYLARDGIGDIQERAVLWLNTMRMHTGGFVSIFDTMVALEALTEYAYRARLRDITDMSVSIEASASPNSSQVIRLTSENLASFHQMSIPNVWGHVNVIGRGAGQAVLQLNVRYGIDWEELRDKPSKRYFDLKIEESYSHFRNKSHITVQACVRWLATDEAPHSGATVLEVEMPSGYGFVQSDANEVIKKEKNHFLRDVLVASPKVIWMFDSIGPERLCFDYLIKRWYPVANLTLYRSSIVYESYSPEHFEMYIFNSTPLYVLDICEVCGSYQCPYCPYFSSGSVLSPLPIFLALCLVLVLVSYWDQRDFSTSARTSLK